jgi:lysozyme
MARRVLVGRVLAGLGLLVVGAAGLWLFATSWAPARADYPVQGIDVSQRQGAIDWRKARADGVDFAYIRATHGARSRDGRFADNWQAAREAGVRRGAYHVYSLCHLANDQATRFIATVPREADALPAAIDLALTPDCTARPDRSIVLRELALFIQMVEAHGGKPAILYLTQEFDDAYQISGAIDRSLWLRRTGLAPSYGTHPWVLWQANPHRRVDGIDGPVDWNVLRP